MIAHTHLHVSDYARSKAFYIKALGPLGYSNTIEARSREAVQAFYKAALEAGASDNGGPGYRESYWAGYYAALVLDPDGHNIEAAYWDYEKAGEKRPE